MYNYKNVQFIAWEIYTGPEYLVTSIDSNGKPWCDPINYAGIKKIKNYGTDVHSQCIDVEARVAFTKDAIEKAFSKADESTDVLKIFMAPEFLYRASGGAYLYELINGWAKESPAHFKLPLYYNDWPGLFGKLKEVVADDKYENWLFIFGTAVSGSFHTNKDFPFINTNEPGRIFNTTLIQRGGSKNKLSSYTLIKKHQSGIGFISYFIDSDIYRSDSAIPIDPYSYIPENILGNSNNNPLFSLPNTNNEQGKPIKFGIEICLDHYCDNQIKDTERKILKNSPPGKLKKANKCVDIQLIPSCGMTLKENSISLCQHQDGNLKFYSYAFNCDGARVLQSPSDSKKLNRIGSHVQIWDGTLCRNKIEFSNDFNNVSSGLVKVASEIYIKVRYKDKPEEILKINADELWNSSFYHPKGSGYIRVIKTMPLSISQKVVVIG